VSWFYLKTLKRSMEVKMKALTNTENIIKVDPRDIVHFARFIKDFIAWKREERDKADINLYVSRAEPSVILVPVYRYSAFSLGGKLIPNFRYEDVIKLENLSYYRPFTLPKKSKVRFKITVDNNPEIMRTSSLSISVSHPTIYGYTIYLEPNDIDIEFFERDFRILSLAEGRDYSKSLDFAESKIIDCLHHLEDGMFIVLSFLYMIYSGGYTDYAENKFFFPFTEIFRSYGKTFEGALSVAKEVSLFIG
jgi:hypothetical protein